MALQGLGTLPGRPESPAAIPIGSTRGLSVARQLVSTPEASSPGPSSHVRATRPRPSGSSAASHASDYTALAVQVKAAGLLDRRLGWYVVRLTGLLVLFALGLVLLLALGRTWWQLLVAVLFGVLFTQTAFLAHDSAHRQIFTSGRHNEVFSRIIGNLGVGLSYGWWMTKHSRHHANPNTAGKDGDIRPGALVFTPEDAAKRTGRAAWLMARQGWFFFPLLLLAGVDLHRNAVLAILRREVKEPLLEGVLITIRLVGFTTLVLVALGPLLGCAFMGVQVAVFGFTMGATFAPNHKGMPLIAPDQRIDYLRRQVLTSRDITGGGGSERGWAASTTRSSTTSSRACPASTCAGRGPSCGTTAPSSGSPTPRRRCCGPG